MKGERRPHGAAQGAADVKLEEQGGSDAAEDPDISPSVTALGGSDATEDPDITPASPLWAEVTLRRALTSAPASPLCLGGCQEPLRRSVQYSNTHGSNSGWPELSSACSLHEIIALHQDFTN